ncbi:MAG: hypothetical protein MUD14_27055 [Hydrococcus sp. Prado102]|nr:hypothetical protein [Hydrococcus sp. Prado102]
MDYVFDSDGNLTVESFTSALEAMEKHYTSDNVVSSFALPVTIYARAYQTELPPEALTVQQNAGNATQALHQNVQNQSTDATQKKFNNQINDDEWNTLMNNMEKETIDKNTQNIKDAFDKLKQLGNQYPQYRPGILAIANKIGNFITGIVNAVVNFIIELANKIWQWGISINYEFLFRRKSLRWIIVNRILNAIFLLIF